MRRIRKGKKNLKDDNNLERNKRGEISDTYKNKSTNRREAEREREREREGGVKNPGNTSRFSRSFFPSLAAPRTFLVLGVSKILHENAREKTRRPLSNTAAIWNLNSRIKSVCGRSKPLLFADAEGRV